MRGMFPIRDRVAAFVGGLTGEPEIAGSLSFDLNYPKIPGRDLQGVPNANDPVMREKLRRRLLKNPEGGQELPGFLRKAEADLDSYEMAGNPFGISDDEMHRRKALRDILDKPGYDRDTVIEAQKQWIDLMRQSQVRGV